MRLGLLALLTIPLAGTEYITTEVTINGAGPFRLLIDTGASSMSLDPETARAAGLIAQYAVHLTTLTGDSVVPAAVARSVRAGGTAIGDVEILIHPPSAIRVTVPGVHGVLGQSFLSRVPWMMDFDRGRFVTGEDAIRGSVKLSQVDFLLTEDARILLPLRVGGLLFKVALDSGASHLILRCGDRCPRLEDPDRSRQLLTNLGPMRAAAGRVSEISAGPVKLRQAVAVLLDAGPETALAEGVLPAAWFRKVFVDKAAGALKLSR